MKSGLPDSLHRSFLGPTDEVRMVSNFKKPIKQVFVYRKTYLNSIFFHYIIFFLKTGHFSGQQMPCAFAARD